MAQRRDGKELEEFQEMFDLPRMEMRPGLNSVPGLLEIYKPTVEQTLDLGDILLPLKPVIGIIVLSLITKN